MSYLDKLEGATVTEKTQYVLVPEGEYKAQVTDVEIKEESFPPSHKIAVEYTIEDGDMKGQTISWMTTIDDKTSDKKMSFVKGQICAMAGVSSTNGKSFEVLASARGNMVEITVKHEAGYKDPSKTYAKAYVNKMILPF